MEVWGQLGGGALTNIGQRPPERREAGGWTWAGITHNPRLEKNTRVVRRSYTSEGGYLRAQKQPL